MYKEEDKKRSLKVVFHREPLVKVQKISDQSTSAAAAVRPSRIR